ncbi:M24 family metallopeptidase [Roseobacter sp. EG26]|uniref:M24 family metallopeptidase n=1 Tax=Roseobacter sp. EG26 TaxID=3412477 RepID=UPI003CE5575B
MQDLYPDTRAPTQTAGHWIDELAFDPSDYAERLKFVQSHLSNRSLAGGLLFDPENMFWLTGFQTIGYFTFQCMFVPVHGLPKVITRIVNRDMALALPTIGGVEAVLDTQDPVDVLSTVLNQIGAVQIGLETGSRYLSVRDYRRLTDVCTSTFVDWDGVIEHQRRIKTPSQIECMRKAARAVEVGMDAALKSIEPGKSDNDVAAALYHGSIAAGSEYIGHPPMVVTGKRSALCFALWKRKVIERGDVVLLEGAACIDRYHVMMARSAVVGKPTDEHKATADALISVLETAIETIKPGETAGEIDRRCRVGIEELGLAKYFKSRVAYGIGIGFPPNWAEGHIYAIRPGDPMIIEENMTFHIIPTMFREDFGMAISDSVRVTATGCELLTCYPRDLVIVD